MAGVRTIKPEECGPPDEQARSARKPYSSPLAYIALPAKYTRPLAQGRSVLALVDDVELVSMATPQLTEEWRIRMEGLGEGWLPFRFLSDLLTAQVLPTIIGSAEPEPTGYKPTNQSDEVLLDDYLADTTGMGGRNGSTEPELEMEGLSVAEAYSQQENLANIVATAEHEVRQALEPEGLSTADAASSLDAQAGTATVAKHKVSVELETEIQSVSALTSSQDDSADTTSPAAHEPTEESTPVLLSASVSLSTQEPPLDAADVEGRGFSSPLTALATSSGSTAQGKRQGASAARSKKPQDTGAPKAPTKKKVSGSPKQKYEQSNLLEPGPATARRGVNERTPDSSGQSIEQG